MVTDGWISGTVLGRTGHFHPIGVPPSFLTDVPGIDVHASPTWAEVVAAREDRMAIVQHLVEDLADADLERPCGEHTLHSASSRCSTRSGTTTGTRTGISIGNSKPRMIGPEELSHPLRTLENMSTTGESLR